MYCPFTGLGLYNGYRGDRWLKNRIKIFKQFVLPSLQAQTNQNFALWISWRPEDKNNKIIQEFQKELYSLWPLKEIVHTFHGVCFYDDKYNNIEARDRLLNSLHGSTGELLDVIGESEHVIMTIQPSDDCYIKNMVEDIQTIFEYYSEVKACGFTKGYICNYLTKDVAQYNPTTNPPFYTIKFAREDFIDPLRHLEYTSLKKDVGLYKKGTPLPSHEYVPDCLNYAQINRRGFLVGTHSENISTVFNHPFKGQTFPREILKEFGIYDVPVLKLKSSWRKKLLRKLPFKTQRKIRYLFGEKLWNYWYNFLRA